MPTPRTRRQSRRPTQGAERLPLEAPQQDLRKLLKLSQQEIIAQNRRLAQLTALFPTQALPSPFKGQARRLLNDHVGNALRAYARALARCPEVQGIDPQPLLLLARKLVCYGNLQQRSARWTHSAFDTRLVLAGLQVHMLARLTRALEARLNAPGCSRAERERLETPFFKVLMHKERICEMAREHQKILARQRREQEAAAQALAVQIDQETLLANVMAAIRQGHPVDHKTMVEAANILHERERPRA